MNTSAYYYTLKRPKQNSSVHFTILLRTFFFVKSSQEFVLYKYHKHTYAHTHRLGLETAPSSPYIMALSNNAIKKKGTTLRIAVTIKMSAASFCSKTKILYVANQYVLTGQHSLGNLSIEIN